MREEGRGGKEEGREGGREEGRKEGREGRGGRSCVVDSEYM